MIPVAPVFERLRLDPHAAFRALRAAQGGSIAVYFALVLPVFIGVAGLAVDIASWYQAKRTVQTAVDAAAYAAALDLARQGLTEDADVAALRAAANDAAHRNGMVSQVMVTVPPGSGIAAGDAAAVEISASEPAPFYFTRLFVDAPPQISARAVAKAVVSDACVWSLHPTAKGALTVTGSSEVALDCGIVVNSNHPEAALSQTGSSCINATSLTVRGQYSGSCVTPEPEVFAPDYGDPLSSLQAPAIGACDHNSKINITGGTQYLDPGVYCNEVSISGGHVIFRPGLYILKGDIKVSGNATLTNEEDWQGGVTFYLTGSGNKYANISVASGADVTLGPMTTGELPNVLFFQDRNAPTNGNNKFTGGSTMKLKGILYFPRQEVEFTGGSSVERSQILLVADTLKFSGNAHLDSNYAGSLLPEARFARLVE